MHFIGIQNEVTLLPILELLLAAVCYTKETYCYLYCYIFAECSLKKKSGMSIELPDGQFIIELVWVVFSERDIVDSTSEKHLLTFL